MQNLLSTHITRVASRGRVSVWLRRSVLLGAVVLSLAMVGNPAAARGQGATSSDTSSGVIEDAGRAGLMLALNGVSAVHRSVASWSDGTAESVFLLFLGAGLIGTGRWLGRERQPRGSRSLPATATTPLEAEVLRPEETRVTPFAQRAAR
ncbi:MAG: hypothetical protein Q7V01_01655 [Vicinamibacterales bacterium]|nr:hypothetical protein [Vicinamibacterales bacterium]